MDYFREGARERNIDVITKHQSTASCTYPTKDQAYNLGMRPD